MRFAANDADVNVSSILPARPEARQRNPEGAIQRCELGLRLLLGVDIELLAKGKLDHRLLAAISEEGQNTAKQ